MINEVEGIWKNKIYFFFFMEVCRGESVVARLERGGYYLMA